MKGKSIMGNVYGYIRVSSKDQNEDRQVITMHKMHVPVENIYIDKQSGKDFNRPQYRRLLRRVKADDLIYIKSIDRLGRNYTEILNQWKIITKDKHANLYIMDTPILDTRNKGTLLKIFISDLVLTLLSYIAENERTNIHQRQAEGIAAAKARGIHFGRRPNPLPENFYEVYQQWKRKRISVSEAANQCGMPQTTFFEKARAYKKSPLSNET